MRYAVISDIHSNLEALTAVLEKIDDEKVEAILCLGDIVGYGPDPNACIEVIQKIAKVSLMGNHDSAAIGLTDIEYFNPNARAAIEWTKDILTEDNKTFLKILPVFNSLKDKDYPSPLPLTLEGGRRGMAEKAYSGENIFLVHSTPKEPEQWHYLIDMQDAYINFHFFQESICCIGHSHQPAIIEQSPAGELVVHRDSAEIKDKHRYIINVGSVGQPRDGNPDAAYVLLDKNSVEIKRVSYDILSTQKKMREAGLPLFLIERLARGR